MSEHGIATDPSKLEAIKNWLTPKDVGDVRSGLGMFGYYQKFVKNFSEKASPLTRLTEKGMEFAWREDEEEAWQMLNK